MSQNVIDQAVREELLNPQQSFIVQAPAGSGKTELLTQRILALLTVVEKPENILAITFTRKAAAEMQNRVMAALLIGQGPEPVAPHEKKRWQLAKKVLQRDHEKGWHLIDNAARLNLMTIDSLSSSLSASLPLLSQTGALPNLIENAHTYYQMAADELMSMIGGDDDISDAILCLLAHKDNNLSMVSSLLSQMLAKRLQWMATIGQHTHEFDESQLVDSLQEVTQEKLEELYRLIPNNIVCELPELLNQASTVLAANEKSNKYYIKSLDYVEAIGWPDYSALGTWKAIAELFLKSGKKPEFLTRFNVANGFPTEKDAIDEQQKQAFKKNKKMVVDVSQEMANIGGLAELLLQVKLLPDETDYELSKQSLKAAVSLLPIAVAHLKLIFSQYNVIDFSELALASLDALGHPDMPTDLALALDYKIEHILIDEFQDTSTPQIELIKLLTAGWDQSALRTLFLVGDPMQSIYRFRDANVGLFMQIREQGLGHIKPLFRQLQVNFRSSSTIVNWVNKQFSDIMPDKDDLTFSAVSYAHSVAFNQALPDDLVGCQLTVDATDHFSQAQRIIEIIQQHLFNNRQLQKKKTLAVLARSRANLAEIIQLLNQYKIEFQAVEIDRLSQKMVVRDLTSLAFALCDQYDELSWVSCMRSPWFGLDLNDIRQIMVTSDSKLPMIERITTSLSIISLQSAKRCEKILPILAHSLNYKGRKPFRKWLYGCFVAVGGLAQLDFDSDKDDLNVCLDKLSELQESGELNDRELVLESIEQLFAAPNPNADNQVQVMTIHKSKGLEFDTVILPRLDAGTRVGETALLKWTEFLDKNGASHHLLAISKQTGQSADGVYQYISYLDAEKSKFEDQRVLYVAATRAKQKLYLFGNIKVDTKTDDFKKPTATSFLGMLWNGVKTDFSNIDEIKKDSYQSSIEPLEQPLYDSRYVKQVNLSQVAKIPQEKHQELLLESIEEKEQSSTVISEQATAIGTVLHRQLQWISERYHTSFILPENWPLITSAQLQNQAHFKTLSDLDDATNKVLQGVKNTLSDEFGKMLLSNTDCAQSELVLHKKIDSGSFLTRIIDRTFIKDDVRWIIDYKSSQPEANESLSEFIEREKKAYLLQLTDYFKMFVQLEERKIIAGLYFPLLSHFEIILEN